MATLVEDIVSLEKEADAIVAQARAEAKELEKSAIAEAEAYRRKLAEETEQKIFSLSERDGGEASALRCRSGEGSCPGFECHRSDCRQHVKRAD